MTLSKQMLAHGNDEDRTILGRWIRAQNTPQNIVQRARIVIMTLAGKSSREIGKMLKVSQPTIRLWQKRFLDEGVLSLSTIAAGRGRPAIYTSRKTAKIVRDTQHSTPLAQTHWSTRSMAKVPTGINSSGSRIADSRSSHGSHRSKIFPPRRCMSFV